MAENETILVVERELKKPLDIILATLYSFNTKGKEWVSVSELQESIELLQEKIPLGYSFSDRFHYSADLISDLQHLNFYGYVRRFDYKHDALLPKSFVIFSMFGKGIAKKIFGQLPEESKKYIEDAVNIAVQRHEKRWRIWSRF